MQGHGLRGQALRSAGETDLTRPLLDPLDIAAGAGIHFHPVTSIYEQGHLDEHAAFQRGGLGAAGRGVTFHAGFGLRHFQFDEQGDFNCHRLLVEKRTLTAIFSVRNWRASPTWSSVSMICS